MLFILHRGVYAERKNQQGRKKECTKKYVLFLIYTLKNSFDIQKLLINKEKGEIMKLKIIIKNILYFELKYDVDLFLKVIGYLFFKIEYTRITKEKALLGLFLNARRSFLLILILIEILSF